MKVHLPRACLFWNEMVWVYIGSNLVLSNSSSSSPTSSSDPQLAMEGKAGAEASCDVAICVSPSFMLSNESMVENMCHFAARLVMDCALCVIFVALLSSMKSPLTRVMATNCDIYKHNSTC